MFEEEIVGPKLTLSRNIKSADGSPAPLLQQGRAFKSFIDKNVSRLRPLTEFAHKMDVDATKKFLLQKRKEWERGEYALYFLYETGKPDIIGLLGMRYTPTGEAAIYIALDKDATGKGYMRETVKMAEQSFFKNGCQCIWNMCARTNESRDAVRQHIEKCGYAQRIRPVLFNRHIYDPKDFSIHYKTREMFEAEQKRQRPRDRGTGR